MIAAGEVDDDPSHVGEGPARRLDECPDVFEHLDRLALDVVPAHGGAVGALRDLSREMQDGGTPRPGRQREGRVWALYIRSGRISSWAMGAPPRITLRGMPSVSVASIRPPLLRARSDGEPVLALTLRQPS